MKTRILKLLTVKSIVTIILTVVFAYLSATNKIGTQQFIMIYTTVIAFYFGTQHEKRQEEKND
ncbi:MAG: hypothetical protein E7500_00455 [Ruminococcus sp.]|nr:hypothetical protein [Ruminococcus sp.]